MSEVPLHFGVTALLICVSNQEAGALGCSVGSKLQGYPSLRTAP